MKVSFTPKALAELDDILAYIAERSPHGARNVQRRLQIIVDLLGEHPLAGQRTSRAGLRRIVVAPYPYLVSYEVADERVVIVGVRHGARR